MHAVRRQCDKKNWGLFNAIYGPYNNLFMEIQYSYSPTVKRLICFHNGYF